MEETEDLEAMMAPTPSEARAISALVDWGLEPLERNEDIPLGQLKTKKNGTGQSAHHQKRCHHYGQQVRSVPACQTEQHVPELKVAQEVEKLEMIFTPEGLEQTLIRQNF